LLNLLSALVDVIDGYESENGSLNPFWNREAVERARAVLALRGSKPASMPRSGG
jgi:hypothetical protein